MKKYSAAVDIGTSACKAIIVDEKALVVASASEEYPLYSPKPGWNEQEPNDWWEAVCTSLQTVIQTSGVAARDICAVGLSGQMHGFVPLDKNGNVIRRAQLWNDSRCAQQCQDILHAAGGLDTLLTLTNNTVLPGYQGGKILWLRENEAANYDALAKALLPKDYIRYKLTGEFATDVSDASGTGLFDVKNRIWSTQLLETLTLPQNLFPKAVESDVITGTITAEAAQRTGLALGTPVVGGGGDAVIQTTGVGLIKEGVLGVVLGTAGNVSMGVSGYKDNPGGTLQFFCNNAAGLYHVMGVQLAAGGSYQWYRDNLCHDEIYRAKEQGIAPYQLMNEAAALVAPGSKGVLFLPYLSGERCPHSDPHARAAFIGLSQGFTKAEMTRAVMEGVTYGLRQIGALMQNMAAADMSHIIISGGGSASPLWRQIVSDIFQLPVHTLHNSGAGGAYGAALLGGIGSGVWSNLEEACSGITTVAVDEPNAANKAVYDDMFGVYQGLYAALKPSYDRLAQIAGQ